MKLQSCSEPDRDKWLVTIQAYQVCTAVYFRIWSSGFRQQVNSQVDTDVSE